jgi:ring-1,2-phenylacetyl-CoA epoxidase subunit PaaE
MIFELKDVLIDLGLKKETVHFELFSSPDDHKKKQRDSIQGTEDEGQQSSIEMKLDGKIHHFELGQKGINILDAGIEHGADLPYSCKGGVCSTCKAKVLEGKVHMDVNYALEEDELEQGYVLACQSHPRSEKVVIDFDQ